MLTKLDSVIPGVSSLPADDPLRIGRLPGSGNWAARLARSLVRSARRTKARALVVGLVAAVWLILTMTGSFQGSNDSSLGGRVGDAIYDSLTFLAPRDGYGGVGRFAPLPPLLWWGRFFGVALSMLAIVWAALYRSRGMIACFLIRSRAKGHMIILSSNGFADDLARGSAEEGHCVVLIERGVSSERIIDLGRSGVVVMPEDASLLRWLRDCRVDDAASVISWMDNDSLSLSSAFAARREMNRSNTEIVVRLDSPEMQRSLRSAPELLQTDQGRLRPVSPSVSAVRAALGGPDLVRRAVERRYARVHVSLHGNTPALGSVASFILRHNWSIHLGAPMISWYMGPDTGAWWDWSKHNYCFLDYVEAAFGDDEPPYILAADGGAVPGADAVSAHVVDYEDDDRTMAAAFDLASRLAQQAEHPTPVQVVLRHAHAARELLQHSKTLAFAEPILIGADTSFSAFALHMDDAAEAKIHRAYARHNGRDAAAISEWRALGETYVHANRAASDHLSVKEFDILHGCETGMDTPLMIERLARIEHSRWTVERLLDGWAPAPTRKNDRRLHDNLVPWADLSTADREKDMSAIGVALERQLPQAARLLNMRG